MFWKTRSLTRPAGSRRRRGTEIKIIHVLGFEQGGQRHKVIAEPGDYFNVLGNSFSINASALPVNAHTQAISSITGLEAALGSLTATGVTSALDSRVVVLESVPVSTPVATAASGLVMTSLGSSGETEFRKPSRVGTWANRTGTYEGDRYICTDSKLQYVHDGSSLLALYDGRVVTPPSSGDWTWINQGTATLDPTRGGLFLNVPSAGGTSVKLLVKSLPATSNYRVVIGFESTVYQNDAHSCGIFLTQYVTGGLLTSMAFVNAAVEFSKWNTPTSFNSNYTSFGTAAAGAWRYFAIYDDGTNRNYQVSRDGFNWLTLHSVTRTDHVTPAYWGIGFNARKAVQCNWFHYAEQTGV